MVHAVWASEQTENRLFVGLGPVTPLIGPISRVLWEGENGGKANFWGFFAMKAPA